MLDKYIVKEGRRIICSDDPIYFETEKGFIDYVLSIDFSEKAKQEIIDHEKAHFKAAENEGLNPRYLVKKSLGTIDSLVHDFYSFFVEHDGCSDSIKIKISLAPKDPSSYDVDNVNRLKKSQAIRNEEILRRNLEVIAEAKKYNT